MADTPTDLRALDAANWRALTREWLGPELLGPDGALFVHQPEQEPLRYSLGIEPSAGGDYTAMSVLDYHTLPTPHPADLLRAARRAEEIGAVVVIDGRRAEAMTLAALRAEDAASGYRAGDAIRDIMASVPVIEEARPMNRKQRRDAARRGR